MRFCVGRSTFVYLGNISVITSLLACRCELFLFVG